MGLNSLSNSFGYLLAVTLIFNLIDLKTVLLCVLFLSMFFFSKELRSFSAYREYWALIILISAFFFLDSNIFKFSYRFFEKIQTFKWYKENTKSIKSHRFLTSEVDIFQTAKRNTLVIDGYKSITLSKQGSVNKIEMLLGILQGFLSPQNKKSLVLGIGSGVTVTGNSFSLKKLKLSK